MWSTPKSRSFKSGPFATRLNRLLEKWFWYERQPPAAKEAAEELPVLGRSSA